MTKLIPLEDRVTIIQDEAVKQTPGGLAIPEISQQKPKAGTIVAVGPGRPGKDTPIGYMHNDVFYQSMDGREILLGDRIVPVYTVPLKEGDRVLFVPYAGTEIQHEGTTYLIMRFSDIISRI